MGSQPQALAAAAPRARGKHYDPAAVYDPKSKAQRRPWKSPEKPAKPQALPTRFPDEDHAYQPLRRVQVAKLQQNTLPPPTPSPRETSARKRHRLANLTDSALWGFPVRYSPSEELGGQWNHTKVLESEEELDKRQQEQEEAAAEREERHAKQRAELSRQDYTLYLYFASKYGALDALLYCCTPSPGRLYAVLIDQSVRKLQKWRQERLLALRKYWIVTLAREVVLDSFHEGIALVVRAREHQRRAGVFLRRLHWRFAASAFRSWFEYTQKQIEVRWRFQFSMQEDLRARFERWRQRVADIKAFKKQLKQVARRKQMQSALVQWQEWKERQQKLRTHLQSQWTKVQRNCMEQWRMYATQTKIERLAVTRLQSQWRMYRAQAQYKLCRQAAAKMTCVARGFLARRFVVELRQRMEVVQIVEQLTRMVEWEAVAERCNIARAAAVDTELERATHEAQCIVEAEQNAAAFVRSELDKVRKNDTHYKLQQKIHELQDQGVGETETPRVGRTQEALEQQAVQLLIQEAQAIARQDAQRLFVSGLYIEEGSGSEFSFLREVCCACRATAMEIAHQSVAWITVAFPPIQGPCPHISTLHTVDPTAPEPLHQLFSEILSELFTQDAQTHSKLLHDAIPIPVLCANPP